MRCVGFKKTHSHCKLLEFMTLLSSKFTAFRYCKHSFNLTLPRARVVL